MTNENKQTTTTLSVQASSKPYSMSPIHESHYNALYEFFLNASSCMQFCYPISIRVPADKSQKCFYVKMKLSANDSLSIKVSQKEDSNED